jgi:hypothetical protein
MKQNKKPYRHNVKHTNLSRKSVWYKIIQALIALALFAVVVYQFFIKEKNSETPVVSTQAQVQTAFLPTEKWLKRAYLIDALYHKVYTPCWEGASGAIGDAYLYAVTKDSALLRFHMIKHDLKQMCTGTWVDDRAWVCLAELKWWEVTGKTNMTLIADATQRYNQAREEGRLSKHEGYWAWYSYPPGAKVNEPIFTNSAMNQMVNVACRLYLATGNKNFLNDALLVWNGDKTTPGIEKKLYYGNGVWKGKEGRAAFGKEIGWNGTEYCAIGTVLYRATGDIKFKRIVIATAKRILNPVNGWIDPQNFYQIRMDGNGAFVNYLLEAYMIAPIELSDIPIKVEQMLEHVWTNNYGKANVMLHREYDHGIRNGWNPNGGEDGYGVDQVGTVHPQSQAVWAFGMFAFVKHTMLK